MSQVRRNSSEYSNSGNSKSVKSEEIKTTDDEKKQARGHLYATLFSRKEAIIALFPALISGAAPICQFLLLGRILNSLTEYSIYKELHEANPEIPLKDVYDTIADYSLWVFSIAMIQGVAKFFQAFCWIRLGAKLSTHIKRELFKNMMKSEVTFFDVNPIGGILTLLSEDAQMVQDAFGTIKGTQISNISQFLCGIIFAYAYSWKIALVATAVLPVVGVIIMLFMPKILHYSTLKFNVLSKAMTIAEETLSSIRTVRGFNREDDEIERFRKTSNEATHHEQVVGYLLCGMMGTVMTIVWGVVIANMLFGAHLVEDSMKSGKNDFLIGDMMSCFMFTMFGTMGLMMVQGTMQGEQKAVAAGARILKLTNHIPAIPFEGGDQPEEFHGHIEFKNVTFRYPTRPVDVLKNVSFDVPPNQIAALVGHSGSGKSTCVQLIERYYDIQEGLILIDGKDIKEYDPRYLHRKIGLVNQEPTLFATTIKENILYGVKSATQEEIEAAAETANAKKFIEKLEKKYDTHVGEKGGSLSGGQRQRVAIARAVIKNPAILLCDEATSALDADSEKKVQVALDKVMVGRTSIIVAHRLSTIRNANIIYVFDAGQIVEQGTHEELVAKGGAYYNLVSRQLGKEDIAKGKKVEQIKDEDDDVPASSGAPAPPPEEKPEEDSEEKKDE